MRISYNVFWPYSPFILPLNSSKIHPYLPLPLNFISSHLFILLTYWVPFVLPLYSWVWGHPLQHDWLSRENSLKGYSIAFQKPSMSLSYSASSGAHEPLHARMLAGLLFSRQVFLREQELLEDCKNPSRVMSGRQSRSCPLWLFSLSALSSLTVLASGFLSHKNSTRSRSLLCMDAFFPSFPWTMTI